MRKMIVFAVSLVWSIGPATAQIPWEFFGKIRECTKLTSDAERLACYDASSKPLFASDPEGLLGPRKSADSASVPADPPTIWEFEESRSPIDDSPQVHASRRADKGTSNGNVFLHVRCKERRTELMVSSSSGLLFGDAKNNLPVILRINNTPAVQMTWTESTSRNAAFFAGNVTAFVRSLPETGKLFIRIVTLNGAQHDATFTLDGISEVRSRISAACKWPNAQ